MLPARWDIIRSSAEGAEVKPRDIRQGQIKPTRAELRKVFPVTQTQRADDNV